MTALTPLALDSKLPRSAAIVLSLRRPQGPLAGWALACARLVACAVLLAPTARLCGEDNGIVAVYSAVSPAYARTKLPDGSFKPETYAFGEGGSWGGALSDPTMDKLRFLDIAHMIAPALAGKNYRSSADPRQTELLVMVYWGTTAGANDNGGASSSPLYQNAHAMIPPPLPPKPKPPSGGRDAGSGSLAGTGEQQERNFLEVINQSALAQVDMLMHIANRQRDQLNMDNAKVLGYLPDLVKMVDYKGSPRNFRRQELLDDVEENRYFVVLLAYDFQTLWQHKQRKILWEIRYSIRERGNDFSRDLAGMSQYASRYFGQDSDGLIRTPLRETKIILGDPKVLGYEAEPKK